MIGIRADQVLLIILQFSYAVYHVALTISIPSYVQLPPHLGNQPLPGFILNLCVILFDDPKKGNESFLCSFHQLTLPKPAQVVTGATAQSCHTSLQRLLLDDKQEIPGGRLTENKTKRKETKNR